MKASWGRRKLNLCFRLRQLQRALIIRHVLVLLLWHCRILQNIVHFQLMVQKWCLICIKSTKIMARLWGWGGNSFLCQHSDRRNKCHPAGLIMTTLSMVYTGSIILFSWCEDGRKINERSIKSVWVNMVWVYVGDPRKRSWVWCKNKFTIDICCNCSWGFEKK